LGIKITIENFSRLWIDFKVYLDKIFKRSAELPATVGLTDLARSPQKQRFSIRIIFPILKVKINQSIHCGINYS